MPDDESEVDWARYWDPIMQALTHQAKGEPLPEELQDEVEEAATILAAATLVQAGASIDAVERQFVERDYTIKLTYTRESGEIGIEIVWDDGTTTAASTDEMRWSPEAAARD